MINHTRILLIDDDADDQLIFKEAIKEIVGTIECDAVNNGLEALLYLRTNIQLPSLIFLDLNMPLMNGLECLQEIKREEHIKNIPVIIFSTSNSPEDRNRVKKLGADMFLTKVSNFTALKTNLLDIFKFDFANGNTTFL